MSVWRLGLTGLLAFFVGVPLFFPWVEVLLSSQIIGDSQESTSVSAIEPAPSVGSTESLGPGHGSFRRWFSLGVNTLELILGTMALAIPLGTALALLLYRTNLPGRVLFLTFLVSLLFIPLPVLTSGWQATLGMDTWLPFFLWGPRPGQPWTEGIWPAAWVHGCAALPWVILIVGEGLRRQNKHVEEQALLLMPSWQVLLRITLFEARIAICLAALWVVLQVHGEMTVSDIFLVRTFSEEVYLIFSQGSSQALAQAVAFSLPFNSLVALVILLGGPLILRQFRRQDSPGLTPYQYSIGPIRWPFSLVVVLVISLVVLPPIASLVYRAGLQGSPLRWSLHYLVEGLSRAWLLNGSTILWSFFYSLMVGLLASGTGLLIAWFGLSSRYWLIAVGCVLALAIATPGPVIGLGLKSTIFLILEYCPLPFLGNCLYYGPSPVPMIWAQWLRILPLATALLWVRLSTIPRELRDSLNLAGATKIQEFRYLILPNALPTAIIATLFGLALSLQEISASKLVRTPGSDTFTDIIFDRMHSGVTQDVAAPSLLLLGIIGVGALELAARLGSWKRAISTR